MNDDQLEDLKQFIDSRISQSEARFDEKLDEKFSKEMGTLRQEMGSLRQEMLDGFAGVGEAIDEMHKMLDEHKLNFEERLTKLEQQAA